MKTLGSQIALAIGTLSIILTNNILLPEKIEISRANSFGQAAVVEQGDFSNEIVIEVMDNKGNGEKKELVINSKAEEKVEKVVEEVVKKEIATKAENIVEKEENVKVETVVEKTNKENEIANKEDIKVIEESPVVEETPLVEEVEEVAPTLAPAPVAKPEAVQEVKEVKEVTYYNTIIFPNGNVVEFKGASDPSKDQRYIDNNINYATTWYTAPVFNGNDRSNTCFAAHTITFSYLLSANYGDVISVYDANGNRFDYSIIMIDQMNDKAQNRAGAYVWESYMNTDSGAGEYVSFQTCIDDFWNMVVKAKRIN